MADIAQGEAGAEDTNITIFYNMIRRAHCMVFIDTEHVRITVACLCL